VNKGATITTLYTCGVPEEGVDGGGGGWWGGKLQNIKCIL
jgi:hypothetical protein